MKTKHHDNNGPSDGVMRVLVVDDSRQVRQRLQEVVRADGRFAVVGLADDGQAAVRLVAELLPDLVLMDMQMPQMDGLEATRRIKAHPQAPAVLMVTLNDSPAWRAAAKAAGADGLVSKAGMSRTLPRRLSAMHRGLERAKQRWARRQSEGRSRKEGGHRLQISVNKGDGGESSRAS